jgi:hypothetical protein
MTMTELLYVRLCVYFIGGSAGAQVCASAEENDMPDDSGSEFDVAATGMIQERYRT